MRYTDTPEYKALDAAARAWFANEHPDCLTTSWVILASSVRVANQDEDIEDSYRLDYMMSSGTNIHTSIGMVTLAADMFMHPGSDDGPK